MKYAIYSDHALGRPARIKIINQDDIMSLNLDNYKSDSIEIEIKEFNDIEGIIFGNAVYNLNVKNCTMKRIVGFEVIGSLEKRKSVINQMGFDYPYRKLNKKKMIHK